MNINGRYVHEWYAPIKVIIFGHQENFYYNPIYNPRLLPVKTDTDTTIYYQWFSNDDGYWTREA